MTTHIKIHRASESHERHPSAIVDPLASIHPSAEIGPGSVIGPYAVIGPDVTLGPECIVHTHGVILGPTTFGPQNTVHPFACIGGSPQDLRYRGERTDLKVGARNDFREHVTVNRGTGHGGGSTIIGDDNLLMAYSHVAHDCVLANHVVMANHATLAGHAVVQDHVVFGGMVAVGAFIRIGESAMLAAGSMVERDVPPFCLVAGDRARLRAINTVGLNRRGVEPEVKRQIKEIFRALRDHGQSLVGIIERFDKAPTLAPAPGRMIEFIRQGSRGLTR